VSPKATVPYPLRYCMFALLLSGTNISQVLPEFRGSVWPCHVNNSPKNNNYLSMTHTFKQL